MTDNNTPNDLDNNLAEEQELGIEWIAAHLLAIIIYLEDKFGDVAGHTIGGTAANLLAEIRNSEEPTPE